MRPKPSDREGNVTEDLDTPEILAGEYVLGTLRGEEYAQFQARLEREPELQHYVAAWERRFAPLADAIPAAIPAPRVWRRVAARIDRRAPRRPRAGALRFWRGLAVAASVAAIVLAGLLSVALDWVAFRPLRKRGAPEFSFGRTISTLVSAPGA